MNTKTVLFNNLTPNLKEVLNALQTDYYDMHCWSFSSINHRPSTTSQDQEPAFLIFISWKRKKKKAGWIVGLFTWAHQHLSPFVIYSLVLTDTIQKAFILCLRRAMEILKDLTDERIIFKILYKSFLRILSLEGKVRYTQNAKSLPI